MNPDDIIKTLPPSLEILDFRVYELKGSTLETVTNKCAVLTSIFALFLSLSLNIMKIISCISLLIFILYSSFEIRAQDNSIHPVNIKKADYFAITPPLRDMKLIPPEENQVTEYEEGVPERIQEPDFENQTFMNNPPSDPVLQDFMGKQPAECAAAGYGRGRWSGLLPANGEYVLCCIR